MTASRAQKASHLGYAGVDIVPDENKGPPVLEIHARPRLHIRLTVRVQYIVSALSEEECQMYWTRA